MNGKADENPYLRDSVLTATAEQLQLMLYDGAIRFALQGRDALEKKDQEASFDRLTRAQHIILEMKAGLNYDVNRELCERVGALYNFLHRKLVDACVNRDVQAVDDALKILRMERETWQILVDRVSKARDVAGGEPSEPASGESVERPLAFSTEA